MVVTEVNDNAKKYIGDVIREAMKNHGYTMRSLAQEVGVHHPTICRIVNGTGNYNINNLSAILEILDLEIDFEYMGESNDG